MSRIEKERECFEDVATYEENAERPYWRYYIQKTEEYLSSQALEGAVVLELGCGISEYAHLFEKAGKVILSDITAELLEQNSPDYARVIADAQTLPLGAGTCDLVICVGMLHHLQDQEACLREIARVLRLGGKVFIQEPHRRSINFIYYVGRRALTKLLGVRRMKQLIGCFTPDEWQLDTKAVARVFTQESFNVKKWTMLCFRLPPFTLFRKWSLDVTLSRYCDKLPGFRSLGTTVSYEIERKK